LIDRRGKQDLPKAEFVCDEHFPRLVPAVENALFRMAQEGLNNASRHSGSDRVLITLRQQENRVRLEIRDWGRGFDTSAVRADRFGLKGIRERARILGGEASIESTPGQGTVISVQFPLTSAPERVEPAT
jgi:signal transduction histidine kinase